MQTSARFSTGEAGQVGGRGSRLERIAVGEGRKEITKYPTYPKTIRHCFHPKEQRGNPNLPPLGFPRRRQHEQNGRPRWPGKFPQQWVVLLVVIVGCLAQWKSVRAVSKG